MTAWRLERRCGECWADPISVEVTEEMQTVTEAVAAWRDEATREGWREVHAMLDGTVWVCPHCVEEREREKEAWDAMLEEVP